MTSANDRRKTIIVDRSSQVKMAVAMSRPFALALGAMALMFGISAGSVAGDVAVRSSDDKSIFLTILVTALLSIVSVGLVAWMVFRETHRVVGPSYRMRKTIEAFLGGDTKARARLRRRDHLEDLAHALNGLLDRAASAVENEAMNRERCDIDSGSVNTDRSTEGVV